MTPQSSFFKHDGAATATSRLQDTGLASAADLALTVRFGTAFTAKRVVWRTGQLCDAGFGSRAIGRLVANGELVRLRYGCYVRGSFWSSLSAAARPRHRILIHNFATLNTSPAGFIYSHVSAARLHGLYLWQADEFIHITQSGKPSGIGFGKDTRVHSRALAREETTSISGVRVTTLERTVVDCCLTMGYKQSLILTDHALRLGASMGKLLVEAAKLRAHRGIRTLRNVLRNADGRSESPGETLTRDLMRELLIELPELQLWITTRLGNHRADFAWPHRRLILEFDGKGKYFDYRPTDEAIFRERKRESALIEAGWTVLRIEWKDLFNETAFKARILAAMNR